MLNQNKEEQNILAQYENIEVRRADKVVLQNVTFNIKKGEFSYLVGRVGSGKSSLMKTMYADVRLQRGTKATVMGYDLLKLRKKDIPFLRRKIGIVFQDFQLLTDRSVNQNLSFVLHATGWKNKHEIRERISEVLKAVGMENKGYKHPHELSGGEQQRIVIARALLNRPELIIADEPTGNLDPETGYNIVRLLHRLAEEGRAIVMATHNLQIVEDFPGKILQCSGGKLNVDLQ